MIKLMLVLLAFSLLAMAVEAAGFSPDEYITWNADIAANLKKLRAGAQTKPKTIMNAGDSISYSDCFIWPLRTRLEQPGMLSSEGYIFQPKKWSAKGGCESGWGKENVDKAMKKGNPELATILFGTNDLQHRKDDAKAFRANMEFMVDACLKNGTIPILFTIPTARTIKTEPLAAFNGEIMALAAEKKIPVIDAHKIYVNMGGWKDLCFDGVHPNSKKNGAGGYDYMNVVFVKLYQKIEKEIIVRKDPALKPKLLETKKEGEETIEIYDRNGDGKADYWLQKQGDLKMHEEYDSDFDGKVDVWWDFKDGKLDSGKEDLDRDGEPDMPFKMIDGWKNETP